MIDFDCTHCTWVPVNAVASFMAALCLSVIALHPKVRPRLGMLIWFGIVIAACSLVLTGYVLLWDPDNRMALNRSGAILRISLTVICIGIFIKAWAAGDAKRDSLKDFYDLAKTRGILSRILEPTHGLGELFGSMDVDHPTRLGQSRQRERK